MRAGDNLKTQSSDSVIHVVSTNTIL